MATPIIRPGRIEDLPALTAIYNHYVTESTATFDLNPFSVEERQPWFDQFNTGVHPLLVATMDDAVVGYAYAGRFRAKPAYDQTVESTVYLAPDSQRRGVGSALYEALFAHLDTQPVHRVIAVITLPNEASRALHARFGFREIGTLTHAGYKFGRYCDTLWLERSGRYEEDA